MPKLVLGPLLRYVGETQATVWVETDAAATVEARVSPAGPAAGENGSGAGGAEVARGRAPTFRVEGHHYALVLIEGLEPDRTYEYRVELDGESVWPQTRPEGRSFPASTIRTLHGDHPLRIAFGSCRVAAPHEPPWTLPPREDRKRGKGADALYAFALRMRDADPDTWPDLLLLLGDQIYADDTSEEVQAFIRSRRDVQQPPGLEVADFEEYTRLYWEAWGDPVIRWLLSTTRWSYKRDFGRTRLVVIDSRCGRVLEGPRREMVDDDEFAWIEEQASGDFDHLLLATSLPFALAPAIHDLEAWNEAVTGGAWGRLAARVGEKVRQGIDLEHWAAFNDSFDRLAGLIESVTAGHRGRPPGSVVVLSGDVHHTYLAELSFRGEHAGHGHSPAWQAVCSPLRNPLPGDQRIAHKRAFRRPARAVAGWLARRAGVEPEQIDWRVVEGPRFDNHLGELELDGRSAMLRVERAVTPAGGDGDPRLEPLYEHRLAGGGSGGPPAQGS
jgi:hypothetical protein